MRAARHVVIFARAPRLGRVKSRLAAGIGAAATLRFYRRTCASLLRRLGRDRRWRVHLALTPDRDAASPRPWRVPDMAYRRQGPGDLGQRMVRALHRRGGDTLVIGSDIPEIGPGHIAAAFRALGTHDLVFGPARDGGYWLVGIAARQHLPLTLFRRVRWSSEHALADTLAGLPKHLAVAFVETLEDVDDAEAYRRWLSRRRASNAPGGAA